jgi:adenylate cyclase
VHVTEFRADAIMCAWTAEQPSPDPRRKALLAALEAGEAIEAFRVRHDLAEVRLRIGLEAGWVYVGHAGGGGRFVYSIVGDSANTASRVEGLNKHVGTRILATGEVVEGFDDLLLRYLGAFQFVGKTEAMPIYEVLAPLDRATPGQLALCDRYAAAIANYEAGDCQAAAEVLEQILTEFPDDGPTRFLLQHCKRATAEPQAGMEPGIIRMDAK